jgi:hypothetical protein
MYLLGSLRLGLRTLPLPTVNSELLEPISAWTLVTVSGGLMHANVRRGYLLGLLGSS